jgi:glycerol-3-phosphate dehydrogenase (NAD(P)+)
LSHLGDYEATLFSLHSNNRKFGQAYVSGEKFEKLAEGVSMVKALKELSKQYDVDLLQSVTLYMILFENNDAKDTLEDLLLRPVKFEFQ